MKINIVGDFVVQDISNIKLSEALRSILSSADYNIVNFEAPVSTIDQSPVLKSGPSISQDPKAPEWLISIGFNVFSLANNHIFDFGENGYRETVNALQGATHIGAGYFDDAFSPSILEKDGLKVAIFSLAELQFGVFFDEEPSSNKVACGWVNHPIVEDKICQIRNEVDYIVLISHAGMECENVPLPEWRARYRRLLDIGCDVVIGGHTHCPQGYEKYKGKYIFYSVGNFCFPQKFEDDSNWNIGEIVQLTLDHEGVRCSCLGTRLDNNMLSLMDADFWSNQLAHLNNILLEPQYSDSVNLMCMRRMSDYYLLCSYSGYCNMVYTRLMIFLKLFVKKYIFRNLSYSNVHMLNNLQCETHRWCFMRGLKITER